MSRLFNQKLTINRPIKSNNENIVPIKKHYAPSTKEWDNSIYLFNTKKTILLPVIDKILIKLVKSYFNGYLAPPKIILRRINVLKKIFVGKPEIKHTNSKVIITIFKYNSRIEDIEIKREGISKLVNSIINELQRNRLNQTGGKGEENNKISERMSVTTFNSIKEKILKIKFLQKNIVGLAELQKKNINKISELISKFYNKKVIFRIIHLKYLFLNANILVEYLAKKINNKRNILNKYRELLKEIKMPSYGKIKNNIINKHAWNKHKIKKTALKVLSLKNLSKISIEKMKINLWEFLNRNTLINKILILTKHKGLIGVKFEIRGRLTRRNIASKSVFKTCQKGTLKNIDSSNYRLSTILLRGHARSNINYSNYNLKTRNGQFNVKGWIAQH